jgi:hypothetical protein
MAQICGVVVGFVRSAAVMTFGSALFVQRVGGGVGLLPAGQGTRKHTTARKKRSCMFFGKKNNSGVLSDKTRAGGAAAALLRVLARSKAKTVGLAKASFFRRAPVLQLGAAGTRRSWIVCAEIPR